MNLVNIHAPLHLEGECQGNIGRLKNEEKKKQDEREYRGTKRHCSVSISNKSYSLIVFWCLVSCHVLNTW